MKALALSKKASEKLRLVLKDFCGEDFERELSDEDVNKLGDLFLTIMAETLVLQVGMTRALVEELS